MQPMLYLVASPIGNLGDLSFRAVEILGSVDAILCEDTRHSLKLLNHYKIKKPLHSYHKFNEAKKEQIILDLLSEGKELALLSDAGTPGISDPGQRLVAACQKQGLPVTLIPGPCALIQALVLSGFSTEPFQFLGFLPRRSGRLQRTLEEMLAYQGTSIAYESPHRLHKTLALLDKINPNCQIAVARELTKKFEEIRWGTPKEIGEVKGECVLLLSNVPMAKITENGKPT